MTNITILLAYKKGERLWFVYRKVGGLQRGGYTAVMTILAIGCVLLVVDWGLERQKACRLPRGMDTSHKQSAEVLWMMVS